MIHKLPFQGRWYVFSDKDMLTWPKDEAEQLAELLRQYYANRLSFFLGHGPQVTFINDDDVDMGIIYAGNQYGKSISLICWLARRMLPVQDYWEAVKNHGMKVREWKGPRKGAIASYIMTQQIQRMIWPAISEIWPADELKEYSAQWRPKDKRVKRKHPSWNAAPSIHLACGSRLDFFAYHQAQEAFESMPYDFWAFDEQVPEDKFDGAFARGTTIEDFQCASAMTPHHVKGRPDTGAHCWVTRMTAGLLDKGITWKNHHISLEDVPTVLISEKKRATLYKKYITVPEESGNQKKIREGRSRYFGLPESSEGLVYDNWDRSLQWIDPFEIPHGWTRFRGVDPARTDVFAVPWAAMAPWGDLVFYREYYEYGLGMEKNVDNIITMSGNHREAVGTIEGEYGNIRKRYEEVQEKEKYAFSVMDGRTFASPSQDPAITMGQVFASMGLRCVQASGMRNFGAVPIVKEWFEPIAGRPHILVKMGLKKEILDKDGKPITAAPRLYVFNTMVKFRGEIEAYCKKPGSDDPEDGNDHLMTAMKYIILQNPRYDGPPATELHKKKDRHCKHQRHKREQNSGVNKYTGYVRNGRLIT